MKKESALRRLTAVMVFFLVALLLNSSGAQAAERKEIVVGTSLTLTGAQAAQGAEMKWSYEEAVADANKGGGVFVKEYNKKLPVRLVIVDDESDPGKAAAAVEKLINADKVDLLLATSSTPLVMASTTTAEKYKKYMHATACIIPPWQAQKFKWSTLFFFDMKTFSTVPFSVMNTLPANSNVERPALLMDDSPDGRNMRPLFKASAEKAGYKLAADEEWAVNAKDYSSLILKLNEKKVDGVVTVGTTADIMTLIRQMKENRFGVKYFHGYKGRVRRRSQKPWERIRNTSSPMECGRTISPIREHKSWGKGSSTNLKDNRQRPDCGMQPPRCCSWPSNAPEPSIRPGSGRPSSITSSRARPWVT